MTQQTSTPPTAPHLAAPREPSTWIALRWLGRILLSGVFAWAAVGKLADPQSFATSIRNYQVLPDFLVGPMAVGLPVFELVFAGALWLPGLYRGAALLSATLLWVFALAMLQAKIRGIDLECGCFGAEAAVSVGVGTILRNVALGGIGQWIAFWPRRPAQKPG